MTSFLALSSNLLLADSVDVKKLNHSLSRNFIKRCFISCKSFVGLFSNRWENSCVEVRDDALCLDVLFLEVAEETHRT